MIDISLNLLHSFHVHVYQIAFCAHFAGYIKAHPSSQYKSTSASPTTMLRFNLTLPLAIFLHALAIHARMVQVVDAPPRQGYVNTPGCVNNYETEPAAGATCCSDFRRGTDAQCIPYTCIRANQRSSSGAGACCSEQTLNDGVTCY